MKSKSKFKKEHIMSIGKKEFIKLAVILLTISYFVYRGINEFIFYILILIFIVISFIVIISRYKKRILFDFMKKDLIEKCAIIMLIIMDLLIYIRTNPAILILVGLSCLVVIGFIAIISKYKKGKM